VLEQRVLAAVGDAYGFATPDAGIDDVRSGYDASMSRGGVPDGVVAEAGTVGGVAGLWLTPAEAASGRTILYFHGGGFLFGSSTSHRDLVARIAQAAQARAFVVDYRRGPESPFPAAVDDGHAALRGLVDAGTAAADVVIMGDSAGGGLALAVVLASVAADGPRPCAAVGLSPWTDLALESPSVDANAATDPLCQRATLQFNADNYLAGHDPRDPLASPVHGELTGFPPTYLQVSPIEALLDDTRRFAERARAAGVPVRIDEQPGMCHVHQILWSQLPEAASSIEAIGAFVRDRP
jgi:epsilon-lactone hydrolase